MVRSRKSALSQKLDRFFVGHDRLPTDICERFRLRDGSSATTRSVTLGRRAQGRLERAIDQLVAQEKRTTVCA
jgi:hypothetical protein